MRNEKGLLNWLLLAFVLFHGASKTLALDEQTNAPPTPTSEATASPTPPPKEIERNVDTATGKIFYSLKVNVPSSQVIAVGESLVLPYVVESSNRSIESEATIVESVPTLYLAQAADPASGQAQKSPESLLTALTGETTSNVGSLTIFGKEPGFTIVSPQCFRKFPTVVYFCSGGLMG